VSKNKKLFLLGAIFLAILVATYSNHFDNGFYFDDIHTIVNNEYIRNISNIPLFFKDIETFGTMPNNRGYRPMVTTLNAIDYWLGGNKLDSYYFHYSIFFWFIFQAFLLFLIFRKMFENVWQHRWNIYIAFGVAIYYTLHTSHAEAINYIIARSDTFSTFCIVAALAVFQSQKLRKWHLYLLPAIAGVYTKETGVMFIPLLFFYALLFEEEVSLWELITLKKKRGIWNAIKKVLPSVIVLVPIFLINRLYFTTTTHLFAPKPVGRWNYLTSQWIVISHYIGNWFIPLDLTTDPDFKVTKGFLTSKKIYSLLLILSLHIIAFIASGKKKTLPIAFGIIWFFVALFPTSSFHPLGQVSNSHRMFFPYIGLALSVGWAVALLIFRYEEKLLREKWNLTGVLGLFTIVLLGYAYGAHQRNEVWNSGESLWYDVTIKSPQNGRGLMNYGLVKMKAGDYKTAETYFVRALELMPSWSYINVNMGILKGAMAKPKEAEKYFKLGIRYAPNNPEPYYHYANWCKKQGRLEQAKELAEKGHLISPRHSKLNELRNRIGKPSQTLEQKLQSQINATEKTPTANNYINLSLQQFKMKDYVGCIASCRKALKIDPNSSLAYNNICSAYNALQQWELAIKACNNAVRISPKFERARNNLNVAKKKIGR